jgi:NAD+ kinase
MNIILHGLNVQSEFKSHVEQLVKIFRGRDIQLYLTPMCLKSMNKTGLNGFGLQALRSKEDLEEIDFAISIGGDGTLLDTVCYIGPYEIPVVGINTGRMGFLATIAKEDIEWAAKDLINNNFSLEDRSLVRLESSPPLFEGLNFGLNEFTIHKRDTSSMITVHTYINNEYLNSYWADGLIVSTPTGSTGYSLSCGGPLISPSAKNFVITPVSPHNLNVRPMVVSDESEISFKIEGRSEKFLVSLDSRSTAIDASVDLKLKKEKFVAKLVKFQNYSFFDTLRQKLNWGYDMRN